MHFSPEFREGKLSFLLCFAQSRERKKKAKAGGGKAGRFAHLVGARDQLLQRLHPLRYPLPPQLQSNTWKNV